jgi:hypothetical protein
MCLTSRECLVLNVIGISKIVCLVGSMYISLKNKKVACGSQNMGVEILPNSLFPCGSHGGEEGGTGAYPGGIF